ncbi:MAG: hypothetical protein AAGA43_14885 [Bacteroidota bacterium]
MLSEKRELRSPLDKGEVANTLAENIQPKRTAAELFKRKKSTNFFEGTLEWDSFELQRAINHRNSFLPKIAGNLETTASGTKVSLKFQMPPFVIVFMVLWLGLIGLSLVVSIWLYSTGENEPTGIMILSAMFIFGIGMAYFGYTYERNKAFEELKRLLKAKEITSP